MLRSSFIVLAALAAAGLARAQAAEGWQSCVAITDGPQRLACFDRWTEGQRPTPAGATAPAAGRAPAVVTGSPDAAAKPVRTGEPRRGLRLTELDGCRDSRYSELARFWELEEGADCGTFGIRGYRPISLDLVKGSSMNTQPTSDNPLNNAPSSTPYRLTETRLQLSVRTKIAQGLMTYGDQGLDSLWFAYSQQSYWQLFTPALSRPFRSTDHEPEVIYVRPLQKAAPDEWRLRFGGVGLVHQSNGQSLPLSRSWNRVYLMAGVERNALQLQGRIWQRLHEDSRDDDNPNISDYIGRAELMARWHTSRENLFQMTARTALREKSRGSLRLEWFRTLADPGEGPPSGLQLHLQFFTGYGDTLLDFNRRRSVFSVGLSLVEW